MINIVLRKNVSKMFENFRSSLFLLTKRLWHSRKTETMFVGIELHNGRKGECARWRIKLTVIALTETSKSVSYNLCRYFRSYLYIGDSLTF